MALITAGLVVLGDAIATVLWQEPLSAAYGAWQQGKAGADLDRLEGQFPGRGDLDAVANVFDDAERARILARRFRRRVHRSEPIGRIEIKRIGLDMVLFQGTDTSTLRKGPGHYADTPLPGEGKTVGVAGHRTTYLAPFRHIDDIRDGDEIRVELPYAAFTYRVQKHEIVAPTEVSIIDPAGYDRIVLTACHPLYSAAQRYAVFGRLVRIDTFVTSGPGRWEAP